MLLEIDLFSGRSKLFEYTLLALLVCKRLVFISQLNVRITSIQTSFNRVVLGINSKSLNILRMLHLRH